MFNIAVAQSGGPTAAINASLTGVFNGAEQNSEVDEIFGAEMESRVSSATDC